MRKLERANKDGRKFLAPVPTKLGGFSMMLRLLPRYLRNRNEVEPKVALGPFHTDAAVYATPPSSGLRVTWFGHSALLVEVDNMRLLLDPMWDLRASPVKWFGPKRFFAPTLAYEQLPPLDAILISHDHYDHLGRESVGHLARALPEVPWIAPLGVGSILEKFGVRGGRVTELDWTDSVPVGPLTITAVPARHFSGRSATNRNETLWTAFVVAGSAHRLYCGADTGLWDGFEAIAAEHGPFDLTMLEIGAYDPLWASIHMGPDGAVEAFERLGSGTLMPIHWGLFNLALHAWQQPIERIFELADALGIRLFSPAPGAPTEVVPGQDLRSGWWRKP